MRILRLLGRLVAYSLVLLWAPAWLAAWWLWPPAPRSGWQIPGNERCLGFLPDSRHVLTEELTGEGEQRTATGILRVRDIRDGTAHVSYTSEKGSYRSLVGDVLIETTRLNEKPVEYPPGGLAGEIDLSALRVRSAWTGQVIFEENRIHGWMPIWLIPIRVEHGIVAYVRHIDASATPELIWRDTRTGDVLRTFPGLAGPLEFSPSGKRFLAARWNPEAKLYYTLQLIAVPGGELLKSMQIHCLANFRFIPQFSGNGHDVLAQHGVYDFRTGKAVVEEPFMGCSGVLSSDGRYIMSSHDAPEPALIWRSVASGREEFKRVFGPQAGNTSSGWLHRLNERDFQLVNAGFCYRPRWPGAHRFPSLEKWLPEQPQRTVFIVAEQNTGRVIVQGVGHRPRFVSPDGRLLVMEDVDSRREMLWNIPFDAGLPWPVAAAAGLSLPAFSLWRRRWRRRLRS